MAQRNGCGCEQHTEDHWEEHLRKAWSKDQEKEKVHVDVLSIRIMLDAQVTINQKVE
jgi:hypothetical protein